MMSHHYDGIDGTNANTSRDDGAIIDGKEATFGQFLDEAERIRSLSSVAETLATLSQTKSIDSVRDYQQLALRTLASDVKADHFKVCMNALSGMMSETGEVAEIIKKHFFHHHPMDDASRIHLKKEMGDQMWYWAVMCYAFDFDPAEILAINITKLIARYPEGFSTERSLNRAPGDI
jgi:NTP pyrophosphatase (non-canonical NTP hydrolase)